MDFIIYKKFVDHEDYKLIFKLQNLKLQKISHFFIYKF